MKIGQLKFSSLGRLTQEFTAKVIDSIKLMGPDFRQKGHFQLYQTSTSANPQTGPIGVPANPQLESPDFKFIEELVKKLYKFKSALKSVAVNFGVRQTNEQRFTKRRLCSFFPLTSFPPSPFLVGQ
jgi:hypothetical protein